MDLSEELERLKGTTETDPEPRPLLSRRGVIIVGCHRSGTSALARVLSLFGCDLPKHVMPPLAGSNELGFWEPEAVVQVHEAFLAKIGSSWDDVAPLPEGAFTSGAALELRQQLTILLQEEYGTSPLFVVKDPRISRLLPLWFAILAELQVVPATAIAVRNPLEVAASLKARDGFTTTKSLLLWLRHVLESERGSRGRPRAIVMYDEFLRDWQGVLRALGDQLDIRWPSSSHRAVVEVERFLSDQHRHHVFGWSDLEGRTDVVGWVKETYFALRTSNPAPVLDQVRDELAQADTAFGPIVEEARLALESSQKQMVEAVAARDALTAEVAARDLALDVRTAEVRQLQDEVGQLNSAVAAAASRAATHQAEVIALRDERNSLVQQIERVAADVKRLAAVDADSARIREELNGSRAEAERLRAAAQEAVSRAAVLNADSDAERRELCKALETAQTTIDRLEGQKEAANASLGAFEAQVVLERGDLVERLEAARADVERLTARIIATESEAAADRKRMLSEIDAAKSKSLRLASELEGSSRDVEEITSVADSLLLAADAELEALGADRDHLRAQVKDALEDNERLLVLVEHLKADLGHTRSALNDRESAAARIAGEFAARRAEFDVVRSGHLRDIEVARAEIEAARAEVDLVRGDLDKLKSEAADERATFIAELDASRAGHERLLDELETAQSEAERLATSLHALQSVTTRRSLRRRSLSQLGRWLLPPTPRKLNYLRRYLFLRLSGEFDVDSYLLANSDVLVAGVNPVMHYVEYGRQEGRQPFGGGGNHILPRSSNLGRAVATVEAASARQTAPLPDAVAPLVENVNVGGLREISAEEAFWADDAGEGSRSDPSAYPADPGAEPDESTRTTLLTDEIRTALDAEFDPAYYLGVHEDVERAGVDPLEHYFYTGWHESRDPSAQFSTSYYLSSNPDVAAEGVNPLVHYVLAGQREGRRPYPPTGFKRQTLAKLRSLDEEIDHWQQAAPPQSAPLNDGSLAERMADHIRTRRHVVISCSHDDYTKNVGGVQLCVALEQAAFVEQDCAYINLHPVRPLPVFSRETDPETLAFVVLCDGKEVGIAAADEVIAVLSGFASDGGVDFGLVVHALHGHSPEVITELHSRLNPRWAWLWLHDYFGVCPGTTLLRNKIVACGAPSPTSPACTICVFGEERLRHLPRFRTLLDHVPFKLVAPSQFMADRWKLYFGNDQLEISVHENGALGGMQLPTDNVGHVAASVEGPARVAFLGAPAVHKGWGVFEELVRRNTASGNYHFYHFGDGRYHAPDIERREVNVLKSGPLGMVNALRAESIDLAIIWSLWEESFSYTAHEALSAGVGILTHEGSGNIAHIVSNSREGVVFGDEQDLFAAFEENSILDLVRLRRGRATYSSEFVHSRMTADLAAFDD